MPPPSHGPAKRARLARSLALACTLAAAAACGDAAPVVDAAPATDALRLIDSSIPTDGAVGLSWVDFAVTGCAPAPQPITDPDAGTEDPAPVCVGTAPLALRFSVVSSAPIDTHVWTFGDGQGASEPSPAHIFVEPGVYDVALTVGGDGGTASVRRPALIHVEPAGPGGRCRLDSQCESGLTCVCGDAHDCPASLEPGLCATACSADDPCDPGVCADLGGRSQATGAAWQQPLCLPPCTDDSDCAPGLRCHELLAPDSGWVTACFAPGMLRAIGESCLDEHGDPDPAACASDHCAPLGARGACSSPCTPGTCPPSSSCAHFPGLGVSQCLARCDDSMACAADPWLACEPPGGAGALAFTVDEAAAPDGYCAPRRCLAPEDCGADGQCVGGYCAGG